MHYLTLSKGKDPSKPLTIMMQRTDSSRETPCEDQLLRLCVRKCDCSALEITTLHQHKSLSSQFFAPRTDTQFSEKLGYEDSALGVSAKKEKRMGPVKSWC